jgi:hypothetical protein
LLSLPCIFCRNAIVDELRALDSAAAHADDRTVDAEVGEGQEKARRGPGERSLLGFGD